MVFQGQAMSGIRLFLNAAKNRYEGLVHRNRQQVTTMEALLVVSIYAAFLYAFPVEPGDDLLRHMKAYAYDYDYRAMWPFSPGIPHFDPYLLFDMFAGGMHKTFGAKGFIPVQITALYVYDIGIYALCKDAEDRNWRI